MDKAPFEMAIDGYAVSTDRKKLDIDLIFTFLHDEGYWSKGIPREEVEISIDNSLCFGLYFEERMIGFARIVTDYSTFGYLADVFVIPLERGKGASKALMQGVMKHPLIPKLRFFLLLTRDAHELYRKFGFKSISNPERYMEISKTLEEAYGNKTQNEYVK